jgi:hypothetical protein
MLFQEKITASKRNIKLEVFASDVDPGCCSHGPRWSRPGIDRGRRVALDVKRGGAAKARVVPRIASLERELEATNTELQGAIRSLEVSIEDQRAINEETSTVREEFQSTNEELVSSKEELQSLNEGHTALNGQQRLSDRGPADD